MNLQATKEYLICTAEDLNLELNDYTKVLGRMSEVSQRLGFVACPCQYIPENPDMEKIIRCPCDSVVYQCDTKGNCHCGVFAKC